MRIKFIAGGREAGQGTENAFPGVASGAPPQFVEEVRQENDLVCACCASHASAGMVRPLRSMRAASQRAQGAAQGCVQLGMFYARGGPELDGLAVTGVPVGFGPSFLAREHCDRIS
jgi:hypothetical protein